MTVHVGTAESCAPVPAVGLRTMAVWDAMETSDRANGLMSLSVIAPPLTMHSNRSAAAREAAVLLCVRATAPLRCAAIHAVMILIGFAQPCRV